MSRSPLPSQAKKKVIGAAMGFGPVGWRECGLPHPVPIACVGCGACDIELLQAIAKLTNGMHVIVENISELSTFFRRQVNPIFLCNDHVSAFVVGCRHISILILFLLYLSLFKFYFRSFLFGLQPSLPQVCSTFTHVTIILCK